MTDQIRWFCRDCAREWVFAHQWTSDRGCPACQSMAIEQRQYRAEFPGGDVPRLVIPTPDEVQHVRATSTANQTLAMSAPEFG